jgi:gamma-glutamyl hercynylcysteine S-oxide synthase
MNNSTGLRWFLFLGFFVFFPDTGAQVITNVQLTYNRGLMVDNFLLADSSTLNLHYSRPLYSFLLNNNPRNSSGVNVAKNGNEYIQIYDNGLQAVCHLSDSSVNGFTGDLIFKNTGKDTLTISNVIPYGEDSASVYITGKGPSDLARAWLFRPGFKPVRVILPDNAWEMGYSSFACRADYSVCSLVRRKSVDGGKKKRYDTVLPPDATVTFTMYTELFKGEWQNGLRKVFRDRYIYDVGNFDNSLFEREDLAWIRESYLIVLQMAWDREFYDRFTGKYTYPDFLKKWFTLFGNIDVFGIWPTWPRLGLDQRNQWDLYRDLPGGTQQISNFVKMSRLSNTRFFISYNPWDNSTRKEEHFRGMAKLIAETEADGVVLDTRGNSAPELQAAVDSVRKGVVMYSEGMAVPGDMQGIISGRVHNAIFLSPELNLNKLIKPDFAIFRVCDVGEDILHREIAIAFFNGYGTELNMFRPGGRGVSFSQDLDFLSHTTFILRQNSDAFLDSDWTPMISTTTDGVYVNKWRSGDKTIYTVLNMRSEGVKGKLFSVESNDSIHYISLWNHESVQTEKKNGKSFIYAHAEGWDTSLSGTRAEGSLECIASFPKLIRAEISGDSLMIAGKTGNSLIIWKGSPAQNGTFTEIKMPCDTAIRIKDLFGYYEGKIVLQLIENRKLKDEIVLKLSGGKPWIFSKVVPTLRSEIILPEMVLIPGSKISLDLTPGDEFIPYPELMGDDIIVDSFLIDRYPVTNEQYYDFITVSGYHPSDTSRYLQHWQSGMFKQGQDKYPVVNLSYEDMSAYARWAGKRLPTQAEWQLAAQGTDMRKWPWGNDFHGTFCNNSFNRLTPVDAFPKGQSPYGVMDMVGNVWQMTNDIYFNGTYYMGIIRGGSFYKPESSWWYLQGGPQSLDKTQILLLVSPGFDRSSTVGFRCVKDIDNDKFKAKLQ